MSELKAYIAPTADGTGLADYYLKSEADKEIADLDSRNVQLRKDKANLLRNNENLKLEIKTQKLGRLNDKIQYQITERHQKYKRCLAMALWCEAMRGHYLSYEEPKWFWYRKWSERWLELAEKFKEAK